MKLLAFVTVLLAGTAAFEQAAGVKVEPVDSPDASGLTAEHRALVDAGEKHEFQAEVSRLMDIIINSLYSNRDIFLRELISNAADATDKMRFLSLQDSSLLGEGDLADLDIKVEFDETAKTITITDKGVGMTKEDMVKNLGVVAKSGTTDFLEASAKGDADQPSLIGQFGVGFYSVYLVADKVTVISKNSGDKQHIWESTANAEFTVAEDPRGDTLGRGTSVTLYLKEDAEEFLKESALEELVKRYSQFVNFPILLKTIKTVTKEVPLDEDELANTEEKQEDNEDIEVSEENDDEEEGETKTTKTVSEDVIDWKHLNTEKAIWTRDAKEITDDEYASFFQVLTKGKLADGALDHIHFKAEGEINFKSLLYIPKTADTNQFNDIIQAKKSGVHLYVRRVLISDEFDNFLPRYLNFIRGVVDSDDLPLNVSRETLAESRVLKVMSKKLVRKILEMLRKMAEKDEEQPEDDEEEAEEEKGEDEEGKETEDKETDYEKFWKEHGKALKFGVIDDRKNKSKLTKLLRYATSKSEGKEVSLQSYLDRMQEGQKYIYYITGESLEKVKNSPFLEKVVSKDYEVIYMVSPLDEYVVNALTEFDGVELQSVSKEGLKLGDEDRSQLKKLKEEYKPLTKWFKSTLGSNVEKVVVSNRLGDSPCVIVTGKHGWSANMQRIVQGSTLSSSDPRTNEHTQPKKTLEINVHHPIIRAMSEKIEVDEENEDTKNLALILMDSALMSSGFTITDYAAFSTRMSRVVAAGLSLDPNAVGQEEPEDPEDLEDPEEEEEEEEEEAEDEATEEETESEVTEEETEAEQPKDEL